MGVPFLLWEFCFMYDCGTGVVAGAGGSRLIQTSCVNGALVLLLRIKQEAPVFVVHNEASQPPPHPAPLSPPSPTLH